MSRLSRWVAGLAGGARQPAAGPRADALPAGFLLGNVVLARAIGRGATAVVYAGIDAATQAPRAVKVWWPQEPPADPEAATQARQRFADEARHAMALVHPNIVATYAAGLQGELAYIVSEFFAGPSLARYAQPEHRLPEQAVLDIAAQLADALAHAHRAGIVHRDVKPANALFDPATRRAALTDFGLARAFDAQASRSGVMIGSPAYMAPELLAGHPPDARSDLYALGVLTYELLAGRPPFPAGSMGALLRAVAQEPPPPLGTLRPDLPPDTAATLDSVLAPLLAKDPALRPGDASAWAAEAGATL